MRPILESVDEVWAYSSPVRDCYLATGVPPDRVHLVPLGVDAGRFRPGLDPYPLATRKRVKFLFVGGTIFRKGFDVLLADTSGASHIPVTGHSPTSSAMDRHVRAAGGRSTRRFLTGPAPP